ncbi:MAG TPA: PD-(D/E)XK nuclease family protein [Candidatus Polarisedimenticolia bacterium]|nr:PD-(D/E)XK nuclease family protein [Candidatus Polarisedimenticolia bacterium]
MSASLRVEIHHDFAVLEHRLEQLLRALKEEHGPFAPAAVVVPTSRLRAHLQERLADRVGTLVEVHFFHHDGLAAAAIEAAAATGGPPSPRPLSDTAREAILEAAVTRAGSSLLPWLEAVPSGIGALLATIDDLREAGVPPHARVAGLSQEGQRLMAIHAAYGAALDRLRAQGFADRAGRVAAALPHLPGFASRFRLLVHYGAYELVGMNLDLLRAAASSGVETVSLAPGHPDAPAFAYARSFWREALEVEPRFLEDIPEASPDGAAVADPRLLGSSLPLLYDEEKSRRSPPGVRFFHAQGSAGELREAALEVLASAPDTAPHRVAVLARNIEPYGSRLGELARDHGLASTTSATRPLRADAAAIAGLGLLRVVLLDFPGQAIVDLARGGRLVAPAGTEPTAAADAWERLLRRHAVKGGLAFLTRDLPRWAGEEKRPAPPPGGPPRFDGRAAAVAAAVHLARLVRALEKESADLRASTTWEAFAATGRALLQTRLDGFGPGGGEIDPGADGVLAALDDLEALGAAGIPFGSPAAALGRLESAVAADTIPLGSIAPDGSRGERDGGGIRVFDLMQARGLSFDTVILLGLNAGLCPRPARPDPFLPEADRARLRQALGRPMPSKEAARLEEHLLLALALGSARRRLVVGWQRADDAGRALSPSLALREIARITLGSPDLAEVEREARRIPGDVRLAARDAVLRHALLSRADALVAVALEGGAPGALLRRLGSLAPVLRDGAGALAPGLEYLRAIESPEESGFDAIVGPAETTPRPWSPSRLEQLGSCPQLAFFRQRLRLDEWVEDVAPHAIDPREMGSAVHETLAQVYARALAEQASDRPDDERGRIAALVGEAWRAATARLAARFEPYAGLWDLVGGAWRDAIVRFVERDLPALRAAGGSVAFEAEVDAALTIPGRAEPLRLFGRVDRLLRHEDGAVVISDYKTGGTLGDFVLPRDFLKGRRLQMPLYALMAEAGTLRATGQPIGAPAPRIEVEVLGVGPRFAADEEGRAVLEATAFGPARAGFLETLAVLLRLADEGSYPLDPTSPSCESCRFVRACRRTHGPTLERLARHPALREFALVRRKTKSAPLLARIDAREENGDTE